VSNSSKSSSLTALKVAKIEKEKSAVAVFQLNENQLYFLQVSYIYS
jgi:hypothetical protein